MSGFVAFGSLFLSLTQCVLALALLWAYLPPRGRQMLQVTSPFWPVALALAALKGALFAWGATYGEAPVLTLGNVSNLASCVFMALAAAQWTRPVSRRLVIALVGGLVLLGLVFEGWRQQGSATFSLRVYTMSSLLTVVPTWMAVELWRIHRLRPTAHIKLAMGLAILVALANLYRIGAAALLDIGSPSNLFNEPAFLFVARICILVSLTLLPLAFHNAFVDRLLQQEQVAREHHQRLFDTMPAAGVIWNDEGRITRWNREAERLFGWEAAMTVGRDALDLLFEPQEAARARELFRPWPDGSAQVERRDTLQTMTRHGRTLECEWACRPVAQHPHASPEFVAVASDISEQLARERLMEQDRDQALDRESALSSQLVRVQGDLRDLRSDLAVAADAARIGMWVEHVGVSFTMSLRCGEIFGLVAGRSRSFDELVQRFHPEDRPRARGLLRELSETGRCVWEARVLRGDKPGEFGWVSIWAQGERAHGGRLIRVRAIVLDITERREAALELLQRRREVAHLSRVNTLGELAGGFAHELNQPLTAILGNAEAGLRLLQSDRADLVELQDILQDIIDQDRRASEVIRRLRRLVTTGEVRQEMLALNTLIDATVSLLESELQAQQVMVHTTCESGLAVCGDDVQLQQVLMNLVINAMEAMKDCPPSARRLHLDAHRDPAGSAQLSVCDSGSGLPSNGEQRVFDAFYSTKAGGLGLGLSICRTIVEAHGGRIRAERPPEGGTRMVMTLPAAEATPQPRATAT